ncbi:hypothetical protein C1Y40_01278 [Mycobacterium talmoniae]|uniref:Uncharacterized protein n=1 Tax=Mycobacterium talmoniae TaxID=1858794 RepID=A0A2S8BPA8_9MYCO|nr:hypothetical protein C1Y40_01278 [Mycobacterium talmoniae]
MLRSHAATPLTDNGECRGGGIGSGMVPTFSRVPDP